MCMSSGYDSFIEFVTLFCIVCTAILGPNTIKQYMYNPYIYVHVSELFYVFVLCLTCGLDIVYHVWVGEIGVLNLLEIEKFKVYR